MMVSKGLLYFLSDSEIICNGYLNSAVISLCVESKHRLDATLAASINHFTPCNILGLHVFFRIWFSNLFGNIWCIRTMWHSFHLNPDISVMTFSHYNDVTMGSMASQITSLTIVYSAVYSGTDQRKHQSSASLAFGDRWIPRTNGQ